MKIIFAWKWTKSQQKILLKRIYFVVGMILKKRMIFFEKKIINGDKNIFCSPKIVVLTCNQGFGIKEFHYYESIILFLGRNKFCWKKIWWQEIYLCGNVVFLGENWFLLKSNYSAQVQEEFLLTGIILFWKELILFWKKQILLTRN